MILLVAACASLVVSASVARAQSATAEGRRLYAEGNLAAEEERWPDAATAFQRAWELTQRPAALHNYGIALRALGRYVDALAVFEQLLALDRVTPADRTAATEYRDEMRARIALVRLSGLDPDARHTVRFDGAPIADEGQRPMVVRTDPGDHAVDVERDGYHRFEWRGLLSDGQSLDLTIALEALPEPIAPPPPGPNFLEEPWLWVAIGVAVAIVGAVLVWYVDDQAQLRCESPTCVRI